MTQHTGVTVMVSVLATTTVVGFSLVGQRWTTDVVPVELQLGGAAGLVDGSTDWDACARQSLAAWNAVLAPAALRFTAVQGRVHPPAAFDGINSIVFAADVFGIPFGPSLVSATQTFAMVRDGVDETVEADVLVNQAQPFNCYRGAMPPGPAVHDLQRTVTHALGHVLGLGHPDAAGQTVAALMNAEPGEVDVLQANDIEGALTLAGVALAGIPFPPRNEALTFYESLETEYRDTLERSKTNEGYVDAEGSAVWFPEWLRYVLNGCEATEATTRVLMQIRGQGIQPVCQDVALDSYVFPARNLSLDFLEALDAFYRDELQRRVELSHVDLEGKAVWLQEYLRYRVDGVNDADARTQVLTQIRDAVDPPTDDPPPHSPGPWEHRVFRATSTDGLSWRRDTAWLFDPASVPGAVIDTFGNIFLYFVQMESAEETEKLMVASSTDGLNFSVPIEVNMTGATVTRRVDPNPVLLPDGTIRLYYLDFDVSPTKDIHSAISYDGINFTAEEGVRFTKNQITDPDVFSVNDKWVMFVSQPTMGTSMTRATSIDGINFTEDPSWTWNNGGISSTFEFPGSVYRTYYCGRLGIQSATSTDGYSLTIEDGSRLTKPQGEVVCDPTIVELTPSSYVMYFKSFDDDRTADMLSETTSVP